MRGRSFPEAQTPPAGRVQNPLQGSDPSASGTAGCAQTAAAPTADGEEEQFSGIPDPKLATPMKRDSPAHICLLDWGSGRQQSL